jgi:HEAT repeat protein
MQNRLFKPRERSINEKNRLLIMFLSMAASIMTLNGLAFTVGSSLFLTHAGPENLPFSYILMGVLSIPIYGWFSQVVDRFNRAQLFRYMLLFTVVFSLVLRLFLNAGVGAGIGGLSLYYVMFIGFYFQWEMHTDILFPSLVSDYFNTLDYKRYASFLAMAMAAGGLIGGGMTSLLAKYFSTEDILLAVPVVCAIAIAQLAYLDACFQQFNFFLGGGNKYEDKSEFLADLKTFPNIVKRYPIIIYLATSAFLVIILATIAEFQFFSIYSTSFPNEQKLTAFMGQMRIINNLVQFLVLYFFTQPLVQRLGVGPMNLAYPLTTVLSFLGLAINFRLPAAIASHVNKEPLEFSINKPVYTLNYNAVPYRFVGRIRALNEGLFSGMGLSFAGGLLWICQSLLNPLQITLLGLALSGLFLGVRYQLGQSYLQSLLTLLRSESIKLDDLGDGLTQLPTKYLPEVRQMLSSPHFDRRILGLELASRLDDPSQVLEQVDELITHEDVIVRRAIVKFLSVRHPDISRYLGSLLTCDNFPLQLTALEALIASRQCLTNSEIRRILRTTPIKTIATISEANHSHSPQSENQIRQVMREKSQIQALVCLAATLQNLERGGNQNPEIQAVCERVWQSKLDTLTQITVIRAIKSTKNRALIPLLIQIMQDASDGVKRDGLEVLSSLALPEDTYLADLAVQQLNSRNSLVQAAAFNLLGVLHSPQAIDRVATGLKHNNLAVRLQAAEALARYGEASLPLAQDLLQSPRLEVVEAAISAIAKVGTTHAEDILYEYFKSDYRLVSRTMQWQQSSKNLGGSPNSSSQPLEIVIKDYHHRLTHRVLYVLSCLDHSGTFSYVRQILHKTDVRAKAAAVEALASGRHRRFVLPIIPLLEQLDTEEPKPVKSPGIRDRGGLSLTPLHWLEILKSGDRWIMIGALLMANPEFIAENLPDIQQQEAFTDSLVQDVLGYVTSAPQPPINSPQGETNDFFIHRVLFLKTVPLFSRLFLDELLLIHRSLTREEFPSGTQICHPGQILTKMYIVYQGSLILIPENPDSSLATVQVMPTQCIGEMALLQDEPLQITVMAETDTILLTLGRNKFEQLIEVCPRLLTCLSGSSQMI